MRQRVSGGSGSPCTATKTAAPADWHIHYDTGVDRVLIGEEFIYWGGAGPPLPRFAGVDIRTKGIGYRCHFPAEVQQEFEEWFGSLAERGVCGRPAGFPHRRAHPPFRLLANPGSARADQRSQSPCSGQRRVRRSVTGGRGARGAIRPANAVNFDLSPYAHANTVKDFYSRESVLALLRRAQLV